MPAIFAGVGAAAIAGGATAYGQSQANQANKDIAKDNRQFQQMMSNTAHRREINDLKKAGLNPILSGTGGKGSSTPAGAMARMENVMEGGVNSALMARKQTAELKNIQANTAKTKAETNPVEYYLKMAQSAGFDIKQIQSMLKGIGVNFKPPGIPNSAKDLSKKSEQPGLMKDLETSRAYARRNHNKTPNEGK